MKGGINISRRIKYFGGQHETKPIKEQREIDALYNYFLKQIERSKSDIKRYQAERNYMLIHIGLNTAFRAEDLLQLRVADVRKGYISIKEKVLKTHPLFSPLANIFDNSERISAFPPIFMFPTFSHILSIYSSSLSL